MAMTIEQILMGRTVSEEGAGKNTCSEGGGKMNREALICLVAVQGLAFHGGGRKG
jgi:hypothetical protein